MSVLTATRKYVRAVRSGRKGPERIVQPGYGRLECMTCGSKIEPGVVARDAGCKPAEVKAFLNHGVVREDVATTIRAHLYEVDE
jgi:hypothetical protein